MARTQQPTRRPGGQPTRHHCGRRPASLVSVCAITEIGENILAHLPMQDLLLDQRVCSRWRELIQTSPRLQKLLFLRPMTTASTDPPARIINPLFAGSLGTWSFNAPHVDAKLQSVKNAPWADKVERLVFLRREASWRAMLLTQPPLTVFESAEKVHAMGGDSLSVGCIDVEDGVRMGLVYDMAVQPVQGGHHRLSNWFYTLIDGRLSGGHGSESFETLPERIFGGVDKFTMVTATSLSCVMPSPERYEASKAELRNFASAGARYVEIERRNVPGRGFQWWTDEGYRLR